MSNETLTKPAKTKRISLKGEKQFKLIDGSFTPKEGKEVLTNLFSSKIQFNTIKSFSALERTGKNDSKADRRVKELKKCMVKILEAIEAAEKRGMVLEIHSEVVVSFSKAKK